MALSGGGQLEEPESFSVEAACSWGNIVSMPWVSILQRVVKEKFLLPCFKPIRIVIFLRFTLSCQSAPPGQLHLSMRFHLCFADERGCMSTKLPAQWFLTDDDLLLSIRPKPDGQSALPQNGTFQLRFWSDSSPCSLSGRAMRKF